jgi:tetratricopeptide (TPR) repeat protein
MSRKIVWMLIPIICSICIPVAAQERNSLWQTHMKAGQEAMGRRQFDQAENHFQSALKEAEYFGEQDYRLSYSIDILARTLHFQKKYVEAEALYLRAMALMEAKYGPEHESIASRLISLAEFYYSQPERKAEAEPMMLRAITIQEKGSSELSFTLTQLGYWYGLSGRDSEAEPLLLRALSIQQKTYGKEAPVLNTVLTYLAAVRKRQGRYAEAETLYQQVQEVLEKSLLSKEIKASPRSSPLPKDEEKLQNARGYAARLMNLTDFYIAQRRYDEAEAQYQHALKILEQEFGSNHFTVGLVLESYARLLRRIKRFDDAEKIEARVKIIKEATVKN